WRRPGRHPGTVGAADRRPWRPDHRCLAAGGPAEAGLNGRRAATAAATEPDLVRAAFQGGSCLPPSPSHITVACPFSTHTAERSHPMTLTFAGLVLVAAVGSDPPPTPASADDLRLVVPSGRTGPADLFLVDPVTGNAKNLTRTEADEELFPAWSPDGKKLAF